MARYEIQKDFIAKNLCEKKAIKKNTCQGKCHLKKQLAKADENEKKGPISVKNLMEKEYPATKYHFQFQLAFTTFVTPKNGFYKSCSMMDQPRIQFRPPPISA